MINIETLDEDVLEALRKRGHSPGKIQQMTWDEVFDEYCLYNGLLGSWGPTLRRVMANLKNSHVSTGQSNCKARGGCFGGDCCLK